jgi:hypothetical protein
VSARPPRPSASAPASAAPSAPPALPRVNELAALHERLDVPLVSTDAALVALSFQFPTEEKQSSDPQAVRQRILTIVDVSSGKTVHQVELPESADDAVEQERALAAEVLLDGHDWLPLAPYEATADPEWPPRKHPLGATSPSQAEGEGLVVQFHEPVLSIEIAGGRSLYRKRFPGWSTPPTWVNPACWIFAELGRVFGSRALGVVVLQIDYSGSPHHCGWDPVTHVIRFAKSP